jgi:hypothetical protein
LDLFRITDFGFRALLVLAAALVGWRRLAGAADRSPEAMTLCLAGLAIVALAAAARTARRLAAEARHEEPGKEAAGAGARVPLPSWPANLLLSAAVLLLAAGVGVPHMQPGTPPLSAAVAVSLGIFWTMIAAEELWAWRKGIGDWVGRGIGNWGLGIGPAKDQGSRMKNEGASPAAPPWSLQPEISHPQSLIPNSQSPIPPSPDVLQQLTLCRDAAGRQQLSGWLRLPLQAGQRSGNLHVAFCPPFAEPPQVDFEHSGGPAGVIKAGQVLAYGARLDVKLAAPAEHPESVLVRFSAKSPG